MPLAFETLRTWGIEGGCIRCGTGEEDDSSHWESPRDGVFPSASLYGNPAWQRYYLPGLDTGEWLCAELTFILQLIFNMLSHLIYLIYSIYFK